MVFGFSGDAAGGFPHAVGTGGNLALPGGAPFLWRNGEKSTRGCAPGPRGGKSFFPPHPFSLDCCRSGVGFLSAYLACGLQDQRLMARPPARAGGRSGLLTGGKSGKPNGYFLPSPKGYPSTSPARPAGGRAVTSVTKRGPQAGYPVRSTASPSTTPPEKGVPGEEPPPPGVLSPNSSQEMGPRPGRPRFPAVPTAWGQNHKGTPPGRAKFPPVPTALKKRPASAGKTPDRI